MTYLQLSLTRHIDVQFLPYGPPEEKYGATFGQIAELDTYPAPGTVKRPESADTAMKGVQDRLSAMPSKMLLLATTSGLDLDDGPWQGPRVGSYHNQLFKRILLQAKRPVVLFLDEKNVGDAFSPEHCFPVCEVSNSWEGICRSIPLAICVGTSSKASRTRAIEQLAGFGLDIVDPLDTNRQLDGCWPLLVRNHAFDEIFRSPTTTVKLIKQLYKDRDTVREHSAESSGGADSSSASSG